MSQVFATRLRDLADQDPAVAPLARLQADALEVATDPFWRAAVPAFVGQPPLLDGTTIRLDPHPIQALFKRLGASGADGPALLEASLVQDPERLLATAQRLWANSGGFNQRAERSGPLVAEGADAPRALVVIAQVASLPLLLACGAAAEPRITGLIWEHGYCPVCAAWPTLLEVRGLERQRWLRCGRCGSGWRQINALCAFCGSNEYRHQSYLAPEKERETRQALTCSDCHGYLKAFTTLAALDPGEVLLRDLLSLELDLAALDHGFARPEQAAVRLDVRVQPASAAVSGR